MNLDGAGDPKTRLTDQQKKKNHIESEKKRREAIREGFERLSKIIPECEGQARSEAVVLQKTVSYLREQLDKKDELRKQAYANGWTEDAFEKIYNDLRLSAKKAQEAEAAAKAAAAEAEEEEEEEEG